MLPSIRPGQRVVTASFDATARVWDAASGSAATVFRGHERPVLSARFSPDGASVLTASQDETARIWSAATGAESAKLSRPPGSGVGGGVQPRWQHRADGRQRRNGSVVGGGERGSTGRRAARTRARAALRRVQPDGRTGRHDRPGRDGPSVAGGQRPGVVGTGRPHRQRVQRCLFARCSAAGLRRLRHHAAPLDDGRTSMVDRSVAGRDGDERVVQPGRSLAGNRPDQRPRSHPGPAARERRPSSCPVTRASCLRPPSRRTAAAS